MDDTVTDRARPAVELWDGATGTWLFARGYPRSEPTALANRTHAGLVRDVAREYAAAGADVLTANSFGGFDARIAFDAGRADPAVELAHRALELARAGAADAKRPVKIALSIPPLELRDVPSNQERFVAWLDAVVPAAPDVILLETQTSVPEACFAAGAIRQRVPNAPLFVSFTFSEDGRTLDGQPARTAAQCAIDAGADVPGANCSFGPDLLRRVVSRMAEAAPRGVLAKPNAGLPRADGTYALGAEEFAELAVKLVDEGARYLGGCCGTTPRATLALRRRLDAREPPGHAAAR